MEIQALFSEKSKFVAKTTGEELLLVPLKMHAAHASEFITLNAVGAFIWKTWSEEDSLDTIVQRVLNEFDADPLTVINDVQDFFTMLEPILNASSEQ